MSFQERDRAFPVLEKKEAKNEAIPPRGLWKNESPKKELKPEGNDSNGKEDIGEMSPEKGHADIEAETIRLSLLGVSGNSSTLNETDTAKARSVMGIDKPNGKGIGKKEKAGKRRLSFMLR